MGYQNFFATRLYTDIGASDTTITLETPPTVTSGTLALEARNATQRELIEYTGVSGNDITGVTRGVGGTSAKAHIKNALVEMNVVGEDLQDLYDAFNAFAESVSDGWYPSVATFSTASGYNKGNKSFVMDTSSDLTGLLTKGMRLKFTRGTAAPTQCADLELSSSQYATKATPTGINFTDDFTCEAWIKLESYGATQYIINRKNGTTEGWAFYITSDGKLAIQSLRIASNNRNVDSYQSIPLDRWVHVAATMDNSANTHTLYIDGIAVPSTTTTTGTITALVQGTTDLRLGALSSAAGSYFDGKIADVRVWSAVRTATEIQDNMNQQLVGNETNLVAYYKLSGNLNDSTANANNLTGSGGAVATNVDHPFKDIEYAIITDISTTQVTVFTGTDHQIPKMTLNSPNYSTNKAPFGFPTDKGKWRVTTIHRDNSQKTGATNDVWYGDSALTNGSAKITIPIGAWRVSYQASGEGTKSTSTVSDFNLTLSTTTNSLTDPEFMSRSYITAASGTSITWQQVYREKYLNLTSATAYYLLVMCITNGSNLNIRGDVCPTIVTAECAYL